jgi:hypothetical protein
MNNLLKKHLGTNKPKEDPSLEELSVLFAEIDQQNKGKKKPTEEEILSDIQAYRLVKQGPKGE